MTALAVATPKPAEPTPDPQNISVLDASHRCVIERCGARAYVRVVFVTGDVADFCKHHYEERADKIQPVVKFTHDERWQLDEVAKLDVSA